MRPLHVITPGDHFSPSTGSAVPTVVHGLCAFAPAGQPRSAVAVALGTYPDRYDSADIIEYQQAAPLPVGLSRASRYLDVASASLGMPRWAVRRTFAPAVQAQSGWEPSIVLAHNAPQLIPLVDHTRHVSVLYAHNNLLRTYSRAESARVVDAVGAIVCVSDSLANETAPHLPKELRERIRVVRNGVDFQTFNRRNTIARTGPMKVMFMGRMIPEKGADVLIEAVSRLDRADIHLTIVGSSGFDPHGPLTSYEREIRQAADSLGDRVDVRAFMPRSDVVAALQQADVVVIPSRWPDPCPLTVAEGMAAGAAVVGSMIGGIPETLGEAGIMVRPDDPDELAAVLEALAGDEALLRRTAQACSEFAARHDWAWASEKLDRVMQELM